MTENLSSTNQDLANQTKEAAAALTSLSDSTRVTSPPASPKQSSAGSAIVTSEEKKDHTSTDHAKIESDTEPSSVSSQDDIIPKIVHKPILNKMMVDHTYTDYSVIQEKYLTFLEEGAQNETNLDEKERIKMDKSKQKIRELFGDVGPSRKNSGGVVKPFPEKVCHREN